MNRSFGSARNADEDDDFPTPRRAHPGEDAYFLSSSAEDVENTNEAFPVISPVEWRQITGILVLGSCLMFGMWFSNFGWSTALIMRRMSSSNSANNPLNMTSGSSDEDGSNPLSSLNLTFKIPDLLSADQLQELQTTVMRFIDERVRGETNGWVLQHDDLLSRQTELNELRLTYQALKRSVQSLTSRKEDKQQERNQKLQAERDERVIENESMAAELQRIQTVQADLVHFIDSRKKSEIFLNETIRHEVLRLFEEVANPKTVMERAKAVRMWLLNTFVLPGDFQAQIKYWNKNLRTELEKTVLDGITASRAKEIALSVYEKFLGDQTGQFDYALKSTGAAVISIRDTVPAETLQMITNVFGVSQEEMLPLSPDLIIQPGFLPGECWPFIGFPGTIVIRLTAMTRISSFAIDYMPRKMSPTGKLLPAPKTFEVYGLDSLWDENPFQFGVYEYDANYGDHIQVFPVHNTPVDGRQFRLIELKVLSNHGSPVYTSICRFRVHGNVTDDTVQCKETK